MKGFALLGVLSSPHAFLGFSDQEFSGQAPDLRWSLFSFQSWVVPGTEGRVAKGFGVRLVAVLDFKSNKPSAHRQFQNGWERAERYFAKKPFLGSKMFRVFLCLLGKQLNS